MLYPDVWGYLLGQYIPATVIPVYPGSPRLVYPARLERCVIYGIVHPHELTQSVVLVRRRVPVPGLARYVPLLSYVYARLNAFAPLPWVIDATRGVVALVPYAVVSPCTYPYCVLYSTLLVIFLLVIRFNLS